MRGHGRVEWNARLVDQVQRFASVGQARVDVGNQFVVELDRLGAALDQVRSFCDQLLVPDRQFGRIERSLVKFAQQAIALLQDLVVFRQRTAIARVNLGQRRIQVAAAVSGRTKDEVEVLRQKQDGVQFTQQVQPAFAHAVDLDALADTPN